MSRTGPVVAVMYQATAPAEVEGVRKPLKPGGYSDSGADIGFALRAAGIDVVTPTESPDPRADHDWVYPDTTEGIASAISDGATILWANTVLFEGHPLQAVADGSVAVVGQDATLVHLCDDKWYTNSLLRREGLPIATSALLTTDAEEQPGLLSASELSNETLAAAGLGLPAVVKPVRGRGSQGVVVVHHMGGLTAAVDELVQARNDDGSTRYGRKVILEEYLPGDEITLTVMPAGTYTIGGQVSVHEMPWALPAVTRFNHLDGVAPYNGVVAVTQNSRLIPADTLTKELNTAVGHCETAAALLNIRAPIRVDCRATTSGQFRLFDVNMKPNMTGPGRPGRDDQDSLSLIAARGIGWNYPDLLLNMLAAVPQAPDSQLTC